jgi:hypothetical protein
MNRSCLNLRIILVRIANRRLRIVRSCGSIGHAVLRLDQFRPDGLPIVGAKHLTCYLSFGDLLNTRAVLDRNLAIRRLPLMDGPLADAELIGKRLVTASDACGYLDWVFVHLRGVGMSGIRDKSRLSRLQGQDNIDLSRVDFLYDFRHGT